MLIQNYLQTRGYQGPAADSIYPGVTCYYRKVPDASSHQFVIREWRRPIVLSNPCASSVSYEVEMTYKTQFRVWATTKFYGLNAEELGNLLPSLEDRLRASLFPMGASLQHDGEKE